MAETKTINLNVETNIDELSVKINDINQKLYKLYAAEKDDADATLKLIAEKKKLQNQLNDLNKAVTNNTTNLRNQKVGFDGLGNSVNQISRELPAFTNSLNTGFMAISNNLPILFDEINKVKQANVELAASGKPTVSVFKTLTSAIFSWGTALSLGVTLLTVYGGKIVEYFTKDNEQRKTNVDLIKKQNDAVAKESSEFVQLIGALKETNKNTEDRRRLINQINEQYGTTLKNISDEKLFQEQLNAELKTYIEYQTQKFKYQEYEKAIQTNLAKQSQIRRELKKEQDLLNITEANYNKIMATGGDYMGLATKQYENQKDVVNKLKQELKDAEERLSNYNKASLNSLNTIDKLTNGGTKYGKQLDEQKDKIEEIKDLQNEIYDEEIKRIEDKNQREQTQAIVNAQKRIKEIQDSNATEKQKAELIKLINENLISDLEKLDAEYYEKDVEAKKKANQLKIDAENEYLLKIENLQEENYLASLTQKDRDIQLVNDKYFALEQAAKGNAEQEKIIAEAKQRELDKIDKDATDKQNERRKRQIEIFAQLTVNGINSIASFYEEYSKNDTKRQRNAFKIRKAASLAQATIDGTKAVLSTYADTPGGPIIKGIAASLAGAFAGLQIATIARTQFDGGNNNLETPTPPNNISQSVTPQFNVVGGNQTSQLLQGLSMQPLKAYVVASDITTAQMLEQKAIKTSVL
jgi:hypothetical protein